LQEWEEQQKAHREAKALRVLEGKGSEDEEEADEEDKLPFACYICRR
jgi:hypothetical protein